MRGVWSVEEDIFLRKTEKVNFFSVFFCENNHIRNRRNISFLPGPDAALPFEKYGVCPEPPKTVNSENHGYILFYRSR